MNKVEFYDDLIIKLIENGFYKKLTQERISLVFGELNNYYIENFNESCDYVLIDKEDENSFVENTMIVSKCMMKEDRDKFFKKCIYYILTCMGVVQDAKIAWFIEQKDIEHTAFATENGKITKLMTTKQAEQHYEEIVIHLYNALVCRESKKVRTRDK